MSALPLPVAFEPGPEPLSGDQINKLRLWNGAKALAMLRSLAEALERGAAALPDCETKVLLYAEAARARALLAETP